LSQKGFTLLVLTTLASLRRVFEGFTFVRLSDAHLHEIDLALFSNAHDHGSLPQQLGVVWDRLLKTDPEGPTLISHAAYPHDWSVHDELLSVCACSTLNPRQLGFIIYLEDMKRLQIIHLEDRGRVDHACQLRRMHASLVH
jgi:hypothetical protein